MKKKKIVYELIVFLFLLIITYIVIFKNNNPYEMWEDIKSIKSIYLILALCAMPFFIMFEGLNIGYSLELFNYKLSFWKKIKYALVGFFFSSISPGSVAGQPMQLYYMHNDKIKFSHATLALLIELTCYLFIQDLLAIIGYIYDHSLFVTTLGNYKIIIAIGIIMNILYIVLLLILIFGKKATKTIMNIVNKINLKLHKKQTKFNEWLNNNLDDFQKSSIIIKRNPKTIIKIIILTLSKFILANSIPFFIYLGFGLNGYDYMTIMFLEGVLDITTKIIPIPGAIGIKESGFVLLFKTIFPEDILHCAMLISRFASFYFYLLLSGIILGIHYLIKRGKRENEN